MAPNGLLISEACAIVIKTPKNYEKGSQNHLAEANASEEFINVVDNLLIINDSDRIGIEEIVNSSFCSILIF